jgi:hypothetical protein
MSWGYLVMRCRYVMNVQPVCLRCLVVRVPICYKPHIIRLWYDMLTTVVRELMNMYVYGALWQGYQYVTDHL